MFFAKLGRFIDQIVDLTFFKKRGAFVEIVRWGQLTKHPRVSVGLASPRGMMTLFDYPDDSAGNAGANMGASSAGNILGLPILDRRNGEVWVSHRTVFGRGWGAPAGEEIKNDHE